MSASDRASDLRSQDGTSIALAESVRGTSHRHAPPRVPRPRRGAERNPSTSPAEPIPHLRSSRQNTPLAGQRRAGAKIGRAPRARPDRRDAHGRRPSSSRYPPGGVRSFGPAGGAARRKLPVSRSRRFTSVFPTPCVCHSTRNTLVRARCCSEPWSSRLTNGRISSTHLDGLNRRDRRAGGLTPFVAPLPSQSGRFFGSPAPGGAPLGTRADAHDTCTVDPAGTAQAAS
jgi:hypothetical protein